MPNYAIESQSIGDDFSFLLEDLCSCAVLCVVSPTSSSVLWEAAAAPASRKPGASATANGYVGVSVHPYFLLLVIPLSSPSLVRKHTATDLI